MLSEAYWIRVNIALRIGDTSILALEEKHFHIIVFITIGLDFCVKTLLNALLNVWCVVALMLLLYPGTRRVLLGWFTSGWEFMSRWCVNRCYPLAGDHFTSNLWVPNWNFIKFLYLRYDSTDLMRSKLCIGNDSSALCKIVTWSDQYFFFQIKQGYVLQHLY